ncbi:hypothetical protein P12x_001651 [Tundrisphaera lichenicola]|uniref:hypothetical protein n=1 Tax=Tundrisphaera lichenicola TaxID=2029860 RepID=UPI003EBFD89C
MPTIRETGKDRWKKVPKDYFKKPDALQRTKLKFSALALLLALGWGASGIDWTRSSGPASSVLDLRANHGTLAKVHAAWDNKCEACHVPFEPIDGRPLLASKSDSASRTSDKLCMSCHAGPAHHETIRASDVRSCAECHRDHRGREASLVKLDDLECTRCHSSLEQFVDTSKKPEGSRSFADAITSFDRDHPPFIPDGAIRNTDKTLQDRGGLKFNHALHMTPGIVSRPENTKYTVGQIPVASERPRYGKSPDEPVTLDCNSCHVLEASDLKAGTDPSVAAWTTPVRSDGKYYQPVNFETQCRACHDLNFDPRTPEIRAPHGVQPQIVVDFLKKTYAAQLFENDPKLFEKFMPAVSLPGKRPVEPEARKAFDESVISAEKVLFGDQPGPDLNNLAHSRQNCAECHELVKEPESLVPSRVVPTNVPTVWFTHAQFDHSAHRGVSCRDCHARSYAMDPSGNPIEKDLTKPTKGALAPSISSKDVLVPEIENCRKCHSPANSGAGWLPWSGSSASPTGGVAFDCTECHTYHNGDHALEGVGASAENASQKREVEQFLLGVGAKSGSSMSPDLTPEP